MTSRRPAPTPPGWVDPRQATGVAPALAALLTTWLSYLATAPSYQRGRGLPAEFEAGALMSLRGEIEHQGVVDLSPVDFCVATLLVPALVWHGARWVGRGSAPGAPARAYALGTWLVAALALLIGGMVLRWWGAEAFDADNATGGQSFAFSWYAAYGLIWGSVPAAAAALEWRWVNRRNARRLAAQRPRT